MLDSAAAKVCKFYDVFSQELENVMELMDRESL